MSTDASTRILDSACALIAEEGIDEVRIARVARRAGASTALVHHYFSTREDLLEQALIHSFEQAADERFGGEVVRAEGSATDALAVAIAESLPYPGSQERDWVLWVELWLRAVRDPDLRPVAARMYDRYRAWMVDVLQAGVRSGEFPADLDLEATADLAISLFDGCGIRALLEAGDFDVESARRLVAEQLGRSLGVAPESLIR